MSEETRVSWPVWVESLEGLKPADTAVVMELARLADWRGEVIASVAWLAAHAHVSERSVKRALARMEDRGVLVRRLRRRGQRQGANLIRLLPVETEADEVVDEDVRVYRFTVPDVDPDGPWVATGDNPELREAVLGAICEEWVGESMAVVARSLDKAVERQFAGSVHQGMRFGGLSRRESKADTMGWAWEVMRLNARAIAIADSPWAMWTRITRTATLEGRDYLLPEGVSVTSVEPGLVPEGSGLPGELVVSSVGLDDFQVVMSGLVNALVDAGMAEPLAWAGTRRVTELALAWGESRRQTAAANDSRLADLGASKACARAWMTLLIGSRRGTKAPIVALGSEELAKRAREVVKAFQPTT